MTIDEASAQLQTDLHQSIVDAVESRRPVLHHLNADSSWLLQIPRPDQDIKKGSRYYFNIIIDPWLSGGQSDVAKWFSQQFHATESKCPSIAAVEDLLHNVEATVSEVHPTKTKGRKSTDGQSYIDAVAISHEFTDHLHEGTLREIDPSVPLFATEKAAELASTWKHFDLVQTTPNFGGDNLNWRSTSLSPLPEWLSISRIITQGDALYYHSALMIAFDNGLAETAEAVIYTPHGIHAEDLEIMPKATPPLRCLAFLHGLHDISIANKQQLNLGAHNGLKAQRILHSKYWIGTHDEVKKGGGLVSWFLQRKVITLQDAVKTERQKTPEDQDLANTNWLELGNGESRLLV